MFIAIEGGDGTGKSTLTTQLANKLGGKAYATPPHKYRKYRDEHEGLSYNRQIQEGSLDVDDFLKSVFEKAIKMLEVGGLLVYRDPGLISARTQEKEFSYIENIGLFVQNFYQDFSETYNKVIRDEVKPRINSTNEGVVISATNHYHREMQRHLITFLDLAFRQTVNLSLKQVLMRYENGQIGETELKNLTREVSHDELIYDSWFGREGREIYTYRSLDEISSLLDDIKEEGNVDFEIVENFMIMRPEYSAFLRMLSNTDLADTKQNLFIRRTK
jgi:adenylate kinase family enzyme